MIFESSDAGSRKRLLVGIWLVLALALILGAIRFLQPSENAAKPVLGLMTTLPLEWSEGGIEADLAQDAEPHPAYARLRDRYDIRPVDNFDKLSLRSTPILLLAQPRALGPAELVKLDKWVRDGGRILILADPALLWGSLYPLGDKRRPLFTSMLSPLFSHWGLELVLPMTDDQDVVLREPDGMTVRTRTPGEWVPKPGVKISLCVISDQGLTATCRVGKGRALLVADADLLDTPYWQGQGVRAVTGGDEFANVEWILRLLAKVGQGGDFVEK
ncbi:MAG: hypothetical protein IBJ12_04325 [Sphingomonadaceae bacterium]|nr:hypothetical protein [Sphingomonadaceae bacterium]